METGLPILYGEGEKMPRARPEPPCTKGDDICKKVKPGHSDFTPVNAELYSWYLNCKSLDVWPEDAVMCYWFAIIRDTLEIVDRGYRGPSGKSAEKV